MARDTDGLGAFLNRAGKIPLLTAAEEIELGRKVQAMLALQQAKPQPPYTPEERRVVRFGIRAKDRMATGNMRLVVTIARRYSNSSRIGNLSFDDLIQEGMFGLMRAVEKFDPERGYKFSTYAYWWIRQSITRAIDCTANSIRLPIHVRELVNKLRALTHRYEQEKGMAPTVADITRELDITEERLAEILEAARPMSSLHCESCPDGSMLIDLITTDKPEMMMDLVEDREGIDGIAAAMALLSERQATVLRHLYGLDGEECKSLTEIGRIIGAEGDTLSRERVRQIKQTAILRLQTMTAGALASAS
jgi:RNA polymerase primary sigma factor